MGYWGVLLQEKSLAEVVKQGKRIPKEITISKPKQEATALKSLSHIPPCFGEKKKREK